MFKKMGSSVIIILCFLALFVYEVHDAIVSRDKSLQTVCASYSKLVDAVNKEVPDREYTINGGDLLIWKQKKVRIIGTWLIYNRKYSMNVEMNMALILGCLAHKSYEVRNNRERAPISWCFNHEIYHFFTCHFNGSNLNWSRCCN